jgi:uncharacterized peroxidase-related enzyme
MTYIAPATLAETDTRTAATLVAVKAEVGMVPNLYATLARAPAALQALLAVNQAVAAGDLTAREREIVALATSQANGCQYCLSAHTLLGKGAGLSLEQTHLARAGRGDDARATAIAAFAKALVEQRGQVSEKALDGFKRAGLSERDLLEVIANVAATTLTNFTNNVARTAIDFPAVEAQLAA